MMLQSFVGSFIALLFSLLLTSCINLPINFICAPIILLLYSASYSFCLWSALLSGLFLDCITASPRLGFVSLSMLLATRIIYPYRLYFFKDSLTTLPIMTYLYAVLIAIIQCLIALILDIPSPISSLKWCISEIGIMPLLDVIWGIVAFMLVPSLTKRLVRSR